jgi:hypothetical protein
VVLSIAVSSGSDVVKHHAELGTSPRALFPKNARPMDCGMRSTVDVCPMAGQAESDDCMSITKRTGTV